MSASFPPREYCLRALSANALTAEDYARRRRRNRGARLVSAAAGARPVFSILLKRAVIRLEDEPGFALYPSWAQRCFGSRLLVHVSPSRIAHYMCDWLERGAKRNAFHSSDYFLGSGSWEALTREVSRMPVLQEARELIEADWNFRITASYRRLDGARRSGSPITRQQIKLDSIEKIDAYFIRFRSLYQSILQHGLLANSAIATNLGIEADREIGVAVDANGSLVKLPGGQHRFALAAVLGLDLIPVEVRMIHCDAVAAIREQRNSSPLAAVEHLLGQLNHSR